MFTAEVFKVLHKAVTHLNNTARHQLEVFVPHLGELFISEDNVNDSSTVNGRVRVKGSCECLDARHSNFFFSWIGSDDTDTANTFTVETEVFCV
jgi:hypothetical protein